MEIKQKYTDTSENMYYVKMFDTYRKFSYIVTPSKKVIDPSETEIYVNITNGKNSVSIKAEQNDAYGSFSFSISDDDYESLQEGVFSIGLTFKNIQSNSDIEVIPMLNITIVKGYYNKE